MADELEISQDYEFDEGEVGGPLNVFWSRGHGHDPELFISAAINLSWERGQVPRIDEDDAPVEMWQQNVAIGDGVEYRRTKAKPEAGGRNNPAFPVTVLDLERRGHGGRKCAVDGCKNPWSSAAPIAVAVEADPEYLAVTLTLCREHGAALPGPSYRMRMVPVGASILLPAEGA